MNDDLLDLLACPIGQAPLRRENDTLVCTRCGTIYPIRDEIPVMLIDQATLPAGCSRVEDVVCAPAPAAPAKS